MNSDETYSWKGESLAVLSLSTFSFSMRQLYRPKEVEEIQPRRKAVILKHTTIARPTKVTTAFARRRCVGRSILSLQLSSFATVVLHCQLTVNCAVRCGAVRCGRSRRHRASTRPSVGGLVLFTACCQKWPPKVICCEYNGIWEDVAILMMMNVGG